MSLPEPGGRPGAWLERSGVAGSAIWGFAEATLFFVVPDVMVGAVGLLRPRKVVLAALAAVGGAALGGIILYLVARETGPGLRDVMDGIPTIRLSMLEEARRGLVEHGGVAMLQSQWIPYKLFVTEWGVLGWDLIALLGWTIVDRSSRILVVGLGAAVLGILMRRPITAHPVLWSTAYLAAWAGFYAWYWTVLLPDRFG